MRKLIDLTGKVFGQLTVQSLQSTTPTKWACLCSCNKTVIISASHLTRGRTKSCGCYRELMGRKKLKDIVGQTFGELTVTAFSHTEGKHSYWHCSCLCGERVLLRSNNLKTGNTKHCNNAIHRLGNKLEDISGKTFGRLTAIELDRTPEWKGNRTFWYCLCVCDNIVTVESGNLKSGHTQSCGCLNIERITKHGCCARDLRLYGIWRGMIDRCDNENHISYESYGGLYISVCKEWYDPNVFMDWAFANGYAASLTIERNDVYKGYSPSNCSWIPLSEQNWNKRNSVGVQNAINMRKAFEMGFTPTEVSKLFGFAYQTVIAIKNNESYKDLK